jgi:hypothetical protein
VNGDGLTDIIQGSSATSSVFINAGDDTGWWVDTDYVVPFQFMDLGTHVTDVNNDGLADIIVSNATSTTFKNVFINKGDGTGWEEDLKYTILQESSFVGWVCRYSGVLSPAGQLLTWASILSLASRACTP